MTHHIRVLRPDADIYAFYDGRIDGYRFADGRNWVDAGAISLGIASYALVSGERALIYDTHVSVEHARFIRDYLEGRGVREFTVLLSHWHLDHIAGTAAFDDCEVIACDRTAELMARHRTAIERGEHEGPPAIDPLVLPTTTFSGRRRLELGALSLELIHTDIHSDDATVIWIEDRRLLLSGDTMEDTITYVSEPQRLDAHLANLELLSELDPRRILPNHGSPELIAGGGHPKQLIAATQDYIRILQRARTDPAVREVPLRELVSDWVDAGAVAYYPPYEAVHRENLDTVVRITR
jgi:glyoxylase-like metal-dependent hydrolase (beta-lactamase superfamily II)